MDAPEGKNPAPDADRDREFVRTVWRLTALIAHEKKIASLSETSGEKPAAPFRASQEEWKYFLRQTLMATQASVREFCQYPTQSLDEPARRAFIQGYLWAIHVLWQAFM
ncbi:MAG: hypothetical protein Q8O76_02735, partial [Chloroflexota bacterium]|nr:hypothetical protein [Chloroflexota bacterium]